MSLIERIKSHLQQKPELAVDQSGEPADLETQAATAILLLEAAYGDTEYAWRESRAMVNGLQQQFGLGRDEIKQLIAKAEEIRPPVVKLSDATDVICAHYDLEQRKRVVALVWKVIDADQEAVEWEESFADHVARAVGLSPEQGRAARDLARAS